MRKDNEIICICLKNILFIPDEQAECIDCYYVNIYAIVYNSVNHFILKISHLHVLTPLLIVILYNEINPTAMFVKARC